MSKTFSPPIGFRFGATRAGIKPTSEKRDLALIVSEVPCSAAGVFTVNKLCAAPVTWGAQRLPALGPHIIVANSGNANALTGRAGAKDEREVAAAEDCVLHRVRACEALAGGQHQDREHQHAGRGTEVAAVDRDQEDPDHEHPGRTVLVMGSGPRRVPPDEHTQ